MGNSLGKKVLPWLSQEIFDEVGDFGQSGIDDLVRQIQGRPDFNFDINSDALYNQYRDKYIKQGQLAMMDTMGRAQAMTGGYANSFAQSAGQQAYGNELDELNDVALELYTQAYNRYKDEEKSLYDQYDLLANEREAAYEKYRASVELQPYSLSEDEEAPLKEEKPATLSADEYSRWKGMFDGVASDEKALNLVEEMIKAGVSEDIAFEMYKTWKDSKMTPDYIEGYEPADEATKTVEVPAFNTATYTFNPNTGKWEYR